MEDKYLHELFRLTFAHTWYPDGVEGLFEMEPTEQCRKVLTGCGLYFKKKEDGFVVAAPCKEYVANSYKLKTEFRDGDKLSFAAFTNDDRFPEHSELPDDPPGEYVYYFNNLDRFSRRTTLLLDQDVIRGSERVRLHTKQFVFGYRDNVPKIEVKDVNGEVVPEADYDCETDGIKKEYIVDLSRKEDGFYTIGHNGREDGYYCTRASFIRRIPLVILELFTHENVPGMYRIVERGSGVQFMDPKRFRLRFGIYELHWRYRIIPVNLSGPVWLHVRKNDNQNAFSPKKAVAGPDGEPALFTSNEVINRLNERIEAGLHRVSWSGYENCHWNPKGLYCDQLYGIYVDGEFKCRKYTIQSGEKVYHHDCPVQTAYAPIGLLPGPDEVMTSCYYDEGRYIAEMKLYLVRDGDSLTLSEEPE